MDKETRNFIEAVLDEIEKQKKFNEGVMKNIEELREKKVKILEIKAGK